MRGKKTCCKQSESQTREKKEEQRKRTSYRIWRRTSTRKPWHLPRWWALTDAWRSDECVIHKRNTEKRGKSIPILLINFKNTTKYWSTLNPSGPSSLLSLAVVSFLPIRPHFFAPAPSLALLCTTDGSLFFSRSLLCASTTFLSILSIIFFMTSECLQGWTEAIDNEEWGKGSMVTVFWAWSAETSSRAEAGGSGDLCYGMKFSHNID